jgi:hypothetical protein
LLLEERLDTGIGRGRALRTKGSTAEDEHRQKQN